MGRGEANFLPGDEVEVNGRNSGYWHRASVRYATGKPELKFVIEYKTLRRNDDDNQPVLEYVGAADLRPPRKRKESHHSSVFQLGEKVEAHYRGSQRRGAIVEVSGESRYMVLLDGEKEAILFDSLDLRAHWEHDCGSLALSHDRQENASSIETKAKRLKLKPIMKPHDSMFSRGAMVEVKTDQEGYEGAWFTATVVGSIRDGKFLIQYENLVTEDHKHFVQEVTEEVNIRPRPPEINIFDKYEVSERVDVWHNDGWWEGVVTQVMEDDSSYGVYFATPPEEMVFKLCDMRPHQDWIDGQWICTAGLKVRVAAPSDDLPKSNPVVSSPL